MSQKDSLLARFFFRSSVSRSAFICALSSVTPGQFGLVNVLGRLGVELEGGEDDQLGPGHQVCASSRASSTWRCSSGACSGPKETTTRCGS